MKNIKYIHLLLIIAVCLLIIAELIQILIGNIQNRPILEMNSHYNGISKIMQENILRISMVMMLLICLFYLYQLF